MADYCGSPVDYDALEPICASYELALVVDGAQSLGTLYAGRPTISRGLVATTSLHTAKAFITGEGGMVFTDDDEFETLARRVRGQGEIPGRKYVHDTLASNYRMTDYAAAIGRAQIGRFAAVNARRAALSERYDAALAPRPLVDVVGHYPAVSRRASATQSRSASAIASLPSSPRRASRRGRSTRSRPTASRFRSSRHSPAPSARTPSAPRAACSTSPSSMR